jgi:hypothetical protein
VSDWIKVEDRLPAVAEHVLAVIQDRPGWPVDVDVAALDWRGRWGSGDFLCRVTHWMPLPDPPEDDE